MPRRGRPSTDTTSRPATPEYRVGYVETFGERDEHLGKRYEHTHVVVRTDPKTGQTTIERSADG
jgi:hypothetical protein